MTTDAPRTGADHADAHLVEPPPTTSVDGGEPAEPRARTSSTESTGATASTASIARTAATVAALGAVAFALWLLSHAVAGNDHVAKVSAGTVDGGLVGRVLAFVSWAGTAVAVASGVLAARRVGRSGTTATVASEPVAGGCPLEDPDADAGSALPARGSRRWTAAALVSGGAVAVVATYHGLLRPGAITWGDWGYFVNASAVRGNFPVPSLWTFATLGQSNILGASVAPIESAMGLMARLGVPYDVLERLWFYFPAVVLSYAGSVTLARRLRASWPAAVGLGVFYCVNPYALVLISGGQLTVGMGYSLYPWVALAALRLWSRRTIGAGLALGLVVGVQAWEDPRTAGLSIAGLLVTLVVLWAGPRRRSSARLPWAPAVGAAVVYGLLQGAWMVPALLAVRASLPSGYTTTSALATFSLMSLGDGLTVFHPFWPRMHFIALYSIPALWLLVPVAVAVAIVQHPLDRRVHVGGSLYLVFAALVSGANAPFGAINAWLFVHVPGMDLFRDPSPYFGPDALGVVVLATALTWPHRRGAATRSWHAASGQALAGPPGADRLLGGRRGMRGGLTTLRWLAFAVASAALLLVSAWPALSGDLHHDLSPRSVPQRYHAIEHAILASPPGPVLWVPATSRFAPVSPEHPSVSAIQLEQADDVGFPTISAPLTWFEGADVATSVLERYDIHLVIVRDGPASYRAQSLDPTATRDAALRTLESLPGVRVLRLPGLTVFRLDHSTPYPVTVFDGLAASSSHVSGAGTLAATRRETTGHQELSVTSFTSGLAGWGAVGNGNNYLHQATLAEAGIGATVQGPTRQPWLRLTVVDGAAVISQQLAVCPSVGLQELAVRYRTVTAGSLGALVFTAAQPKPLASVSLPPTDGRWRTVTEPFVLAPALTGGQQHRLLTGCTFDLSLFPSDAGQRAVAEVRSVSMVSASPPSFTGVASTQHPSGVWHRARHGATVRSNASGTTVHVVLPPSATTRLLGYWQRFDPGWVATATAAGVGSIDHVEVDGWANGYVLPPTHRPVTITISYGPQSLTSDGFILVIVGIALVLGCGAVVITRWLRRRLRAP